tara:strand:+ start:3547 stop:4071 length:525 start_codon:yes stop_codon:yes gene_type:complete
MAFLDIFSAPDPAFFTDEELSLIRNSFNSLIKKYDDYEFVQEWKTEHPKIDRSIDVPNRERETFDYTIKCNSNEYCIHFNKGGFFTNKYKSNFKGADIVKDIEDFLQGEKIDGREIVAWVRINASILEEGKWYRFEGFSKWLVIRYELPEQNLHYNKQTKEKFKDLEDYYMEKI